MVDVHCPRSFKPTIPALTAFLAGVFIPFEDIPAHIMPYMRVTDVHVTGNQFGFLNLPFIFSVTFFGETGFIMMQFILVRIRFWVIRERLTGGWNLNRSTTGRLV